MESGKWKVESVGMFQIVPQNDITLAFLLFVQRTSAGEHCSPLRMNSSLLTPNSSLYALPFAAGQARLVPTIPLLTPHSSLLRCPSQPDKQGLSLQFHSSFLIPHSCAVLRRRASDARPYVLLLPIASFPIACATFHFPFSTPKKIPLRKQRRGIFYGSYSSSSLASSMIFC